MSTRAILGEPADTTGAPPPKNVYVLFGGDNDMSWWMNASRPKNDIGWVVGNGEMTVAPRTGSIMTRMDGRDFMAHVEFNVPDGEGNSGVYLQRSYEIQILNSFGRGRTSTGCGGIYGKRAPDVNASRPAGEWQSFDIVFRAARWENGEKIENARVSVVHNGVLIHDDAEIDGETGAGAEESERDRPALFLQDHGNPVKFRNIWLKPLLLCDWAEAAGPDEIIAALNLAGPADKAAIIRALPSYVTAEQAMPLLEEALGHESPAVRLAALHASCVAGGADIVPMIRNMLDDNDGGIRLAALLALGRMGHASALPAILNMLHDADLYVRLHALRAIGRLGNVSAIPLLAEAACSVDPDTRATARASLAGLAGEEIEPALLAFASDPAEAPEIRAEIIIALAARHAVDAVPRLLEAARGTEQHVRMAALAALGVLADAKAAAEMTALTMDARDRHEQLVAADALAAIVVRAGTPESAVGFVASACDRAEPGPRRGLLRALSRIGGEQALAPVRHALNDADANVSDAALRAMAEWPDPAPVKDLLARARDGATEDERAIALAGHVRMIELYQGVPAGARVDMYEAAMDLAERDREKRLVYEGLGRLPDSRTIAFLEQCLEEIHAFGEVHLLPHAEKAYVDAAIPLAKTHPAEAVEALMRFCGASENKELVERAAKAIQDAGK